MSETPEPTPTESPDPQPATPTLAENTAAANAELDAQSPPLTDAERATAPDRLNQLAGDIIAQVPPEKRGAVVGALLEGAAKSDPRTTYRDLPNPIPSVGRVLHLESSAWVGVRPATIVLVNRARKTVDVNVQLHGQLDQALLTGVRLCPSGNTIDGLVINESVDAGVFGTVLATWPGRN